MGEEDSNEVEMSPIINSQNLVHDLVLTKRGMLYFFSSAYANISEVYGHFALLSVPEMGGANEFSTFQKVLTGGQERREDDDEEEKPRDVIIHPILAIRRSLVFSLQSQSPRDIIDRGDALCDAPYFRRKFAEEAELQAMRKAESCEDDSSWRSSCCQGARALHTSLQKGIRRCLPLSSHPFPFLSRSLSLPLFLAHSLTSPPLPALPRMRKRRCV